LTVGDILFGSSIAVAIAVMCLMLRVAVEAERGQRTNRRLARTQQSAPLVASVISNTPLIVVCIAVLVLASPALAIATVVCVLVIRYSWAKYQRIASDRQYLRDLPLCLDAVARNMRAGGGLVNSFDEVGQESASLPARDLALVAQRVKAGVGLSTSLRQWSASRDFNDVRRVSSSLCLAMESGAAHAQVIDGVAMGLRQAQAASANAKVHSTQARASALVLTALPLLFTGPMLLIDPSVRNFLLHSGLGQITLLVGLLLDGAGAWWMARMIRKATSL
jgi:tight adherence protein B